MRKIINRRFMDIALFSIIVTTLVMTVVFYTQLKKQVFSDLEIVTKLLIDEQSYEKETSNLRITVIDKDGRVEFDSTMDAGSLENHNNRPEVIEAIENGEGYGVRKSDTLSKNVFYYAKLMDNGQILRVGKEAHKVLSVSL